MTTATTTALILVALSVMEVDSRCRNLRCYYKTGPGIRDRILLSWSRRTCGFLLSCYRANDRVPSRCGFNLGKSTINKLCKIYGAPAWPQQSKFSVYRHGKADCKNHNDINNWYIRPRQHEAKTTICCTTIDFGGQQILAKRC